MTVQPEKKRKERERRGITFVKASSPPPAPISFCRKSYWKITEQLDAKKKTTHRNNKIMVPAAESADSNSRQAIAGHQGNFSLIGIARSEQGRKEGRKVVRFVSSFPFPCCSNMDNWISGERVSVIFLDVSHDGRARAKEEKYFFR